MVSITGSIDNAAIWNTQYHLIFTGDEVLQFLVMTGKERVSDIYRADMSNPMRMAPIAGQVANYSTTRDEVKLIVEENIRRGKEIESRLDEILESPPEGFSRIPYESIDSAELSNGTKVSLPHLILRTGRKSLKFHLVHSNYQGRGKLDDETFGKYRDILSSVLGGRLKVKE